LRTARPPLRDRLRLRVARRLARRRMGAARVAAERARGTAPMRAPRRGAIAPRDRPVQRAAPPAAASLREPLTLYDDADSPHARRIRILLREKSLAWHTVTVPLHLLAHKAPDYLAVHPAGEVPALRHGERVIYDSQVIAEYLDRTYAGHPLYPDEAYALAQVRMWLALEAGTHKELRPLFALHVIRPRLHAAGASAEHLADAVPPGVHPSHLAWLHDTLRGTVRFDSSESLARTIIARKLAVVAERLRERDYLVGDTLTMADLAWFTRLDMLPRLGVELPDVLARWVANIARRPATVEPGSAGGSPAVGRG
jgi:glutathione S-transferase